MNPESVFLSSSIFGVNKLLFIHQNSEMKTLKILSIIMVVLTVVAVVVTVYNAVQLNKAMKESVNDSAINPSPNTLTRELELEESAAG